jgi:NAD(P)-dependent dehydrogenase (short-subunit alcohol dehydrogenase family)
LDRFDEHEWALILGGSSGFGLATAHALAEHGMNLCLVHRDRRGALARIEPEFEKLRGHGVELLTFNADALSAEKRGEILDQLAGALGEAGRVRVLLHSIAFGNLKLLGPERPRDGAARARAALAESLGIEADRLTEAADALLADGHDALVGLASAPVYSDQHFLEEEDFARTIHAMGTSLLDWTQDLLARGLFAPDTRVFGLTSEGNTVAWKGYAAVAAAKVALESVARSIAVELAGSDHLKAQARARNPFGRLTTPRDVARAIYLLSLDEAAWINGEVIRVDGGEHVSGLLG